MDWINRERGVTVIKGFNMRGEVAYEPPLVRMHPRPSRSKYEPHFGTKQANRLLNSL